MKRVVLLLAVVGLVVAGCGSGTKTPGVASLGSGVTTSQNATPPAGGSLSSGRGSGSGLHLAMRGNLKYSQCMRAHGVANFPDPDSNGVIGITSSSGIDPRSPAFQSAQKACAKDLPNGGKPNPQQLAKAKQAALAYSACMRAHGVKDFPDPDFSGGGVSVRLGGPQGSDLDPNNPTFKQAQSVCRTDLNFPKG